MLPLIILLFPDGRLPSPRWRWVLRGYLVAVVADVLAQVQMSVYAIAQHHTQVDGSGQLVLASQRYQAVFVPAALIFFALWLLAVGYQVVSWRRAVGDVRQQRTWLIAGGVAALISFIAGGLIGAAGGAWQVVAGVVLIGIAALPAGMGVAILKYRLYEIDRIISRTLAYTIVTWAAGRGVRRAGAPGQAGVLGEFAGRGGRVHAGRGGPVQSGAAAGAAGGGPPVQPGPVRRRPHGGGVRSPAE